MNHIHSTSAQCKFTKPQHYSSPKNHNLLSLMSFKTCRNVLFLWNKIQLWNDMRVLFSFLSISYMLVFKLVSSHDFMNVRSSCSFEDGMWVKPLSTSISGQCIICLKTPEVALLSCITWKALWCNAFVYVPYLHQVPPDHVIPSPEEIYIYSPLGTAFKVQGGDSTAKNPSIVTM